MEWRTAVDVVMSEVRADMSEWEREFGVFADAAFISSRIKGAYESNPRWVTHLADDQREALNMVADAASVAITGNPNNLALWRHIAGSALFVAARIKKEMEERCHQKTVRGVGSDVLPVPSAEM